MKRTHLTSIAVAAAFLLGGCAVSGPTPPSTPPTAASPATSSTPAPSLPAGATAATNVPTAVPNDPDLRKSVTITKCAATKAGWTAQGTATNSKKTSKTYKIAVFFTSASATVLHTDSTTVTVKPGDKATWTINAKFTAPEGTLCVLRGVA